MTGEPGVDCPECSTRLTGPQCGCGWKPASTSAGRCIECGAARVELDDDGELRCAACHVEWLRARAVLDPIEAHELESCRAQIRAALDRVAARAAGGPRSIAVSEGPGRELSGSHPEN